MANPSKLKYGRVVEALTGERAVFLLDDRMGPTVLTDRRLSIAKIKHGHGMCCHPVGEPNPPPPVPPSVQVQSMVITGNDVRISQHINVHAQTESRLQFPHITKVMCL